MVSNNRQQHIKPKHDEERSDYTGYEAFRISLSQSSAEKIASGEPSGYYFQKIENWVGLANCLILFLYTVITYSLWRAQINANDINARNVVESNRAWIAPAFLSLDKPIQIGQDISVAIPVINIGHDPAIGLAYTAIYRAVPHIKEDNTSGPDIGPNRTCDSLQADVANGPTAYPSTQNNFYVPWHFRASAETDLHISRIVTKKESLIVEGCLAYLTFGEQHTSRFRFFLRDNSDPSCYPDPKNASKFICWPFNVMLTGNNAE